MTTGSPAKPENTPTAQKPRAPGTKIDKPAHESTHNANKIKSLSDGPVPAPDGVNTNKPSSTPTAQKPRAPGTKIDKPTWNESHNSMKVKTNRSQSAPRTVKEKTPEELAHNALKAKTAKK